MAESSTKEDTAMEEEEEEEESMAGNVEVDESPLKPCLNRNKESLKIRLQMRRPINQLVEQGILPSPNTTPAFASQRVKLERARMGDFLKAKIQQRPSRQELVRQHILEETDPRVAPLLAEKQRMLKRARLADSLNDHLIHRPGPLELVKKNILHAPDESIEKAIKEGIVPFKATCEGATPGPPLPTKYQVSQEDDSSSSDVSSPSLNLDSSQEEVTVPEPVVEVQNKAVPISIVVPQPPPPPPPPPFRFENASTLSTTLPAIAPTLPATATTMATTMATGQIFTLPLFASANASIIQPQPVTFQQPLSKSRSKKGGKSAKSQSKKFQIKFHEYKGPPNAQKSSPPSTEQTKPPESSYELLLQQQQLFLQWQLEWQHRFPKILLPAVSKMTPEEKKAFCTTLQSSSSSFPSTLSHSLHPVSTEGLQLISSPSSNSVLILSSTEPSNTHQNVTYQPAKVSSTLVIAPKPTIIQPKPAPVSIDIVKIPPKLTDWKVNELKAELKKRNLPVSGSKAQLVERLQGAREETPPKKELTFFVNSNQSPLKGQVAVISTGDNNEQQQQQQEIVKEPPLQQSSRSALQQKIQQKLQQQQAKTQIDLLWNDKDVLLQDTPPTEAGVEEPPTEDPWVLKITESSNPPASFENCLADLLSGDVTQQQETLNHAIDTAQLDQHIKSQMVDDVLEILIRNGELPASAAQDMVSQKPPPAPPPLPPTTFAITLPTEISYRRMQEPQKTPPAPTQQQERKGSLGITSLTREAADILKISESPFLHQPPPEVKKEEELMEMDDKSNGDSIRVIDELLTLEFPMMDADSPMDEYSDWLESFSSDNHFTNHFNNKTTTDPTDPERDPLLSGKSFKILDNFSTTATGSNMMDVDSNNQTDIKISKNLTNVNELFDFSF